MPSKQTHSETSKRILTAFALIIMCGAAYSASPNVVALTPTDKLIIFNSATPNTTSTPVSITGLEAGQTVVAIDYRPATGELFGITQLRPRVTTQPCQVYSINITTGVATKVGQFASDINGSDFGADFNPTVDRIRVVVNNTSNVRVNPDTGGAVDGDAITTGTQPDTQLAYATGDVNFGQTPNVVASAYTNNFEGATVTTLFGIDSNLNSLVRQGSPDGSPSSPNLGQLFTVGPLGVDVVADAGFDISATGEAFAAMASAGDLTSKLYSINLSTGAATLVGTIGGSELIRGITLLPAGQVEFSSATYGVDEDAGTATITVNRINGSDGAIAVDFVTSNGTATAPDDYTTTSGTLTFADDEISKTFSVPIIADSVSDTDETVTLTLGNVGGGAVLGATATATLTIQNKPVFTSFPVATGASNTLLNIPLSAVGTLPITFSSTNLPSGLSISGNAIVGTSLAAGTFTVTITATNVAGSTDQTLKLFITGSGVSKTLVDVDGDGFPDEIENAAGVGTNPLAIGSTPFGGLPAGTVQPLVVSKLQIKLNFAKTNSDSIAFSGTLPIPAGFAVSGQVVIADVGGVVKVFTLSSKGASPKANDTFKLKVKASKGVVLQQVGKYQAKFNKGDFAAQLFDEGLENTEIKDILRTVPVIVLFNQTYYQKDQLQLYTAKVTKSGRTKQPK
jgi:hypothetical protein